MKVNVVFQLRPTVVIVGLLNANQPACFGVVVEVVLKNLNFLL